jgi:hypothetical protein
MGEELCVPWHTFDSHDPIIASPTGGVLLSLMVGSHDCKTGGGGWRMCVISQRRWFGWRLTATVAVEGTQRRWGGLLWGGSGPNDGFLFWQNWPDG